MGTRSVRQIQQALKDKGFDPGDIDGVLGRNTIAAVKLFQRQQGLNADGIVGPKTTAALFAGAPTTAAPPDDTLIPWYEEAKHLMGTKEVAGDGNSAVILDWANDLDIHYPADEIPWCGLFVAHCVGLTLQQEVLPGNPLGARQWERFGDKTKPRVGAVMVFWRKSKTSGLGHVGFYAGEDKNAYQILGGNQSDKVCLTWVGKDRFVTARWPTSAAGLETNSITKGRNDGLPLSQDEA